MEKECCAVEEKTANEYLKENRELILNIKYISREILGAIYGVEVKDESTLDINCLMKALEEQNSNLKEIIDNLVRIKNTLIAK